MGTGDIQASINSIPAKKEDLRKAFEDLESYSSFFASFTLQWKDIDDHFSSIEKSIDKRFQELKENAASENPTAPVSAANVNVDQDKPVIEPCMDMKSHCINMDVMGLISYIIGHLEDIEAVRRELGPALLCSPDPVTLVLDSFEGFAWSCEMMKPKHHAIRKAYLIILECFHGLKLEFKPSDKERARQVAKDCDHLIKKGERHHEVVLIFFLYLIATFGLLEYFAIDDILDILVTVKENIVDLCRNSAFEEKMPDLIDKLNKKGRQLDSVKYVLAFNLQHKFPLKSLFKAHIKESKKSLQKGAMEGKNSPQLEHEVISKQIVAIREVIKSVEELNLGHLYPSGSLQNRIHLLEKQRLEIKPVASPPSHEKQKHQQQVNKRPRPSDSSPTVLHPYAPTVLPLHPHPQSPYMGLVSPYGLIAAPPMPYLYPLPGPAYKVRPVSYDGYSNSGFPPYNPSPYS